LEKHTVLIVDDEEGIRSQLKWALADRFQILEAAGVEDAVALAREHRPLVVLQDISLTPRENAAEGLTLIEKYHYGNRSRPEGKRPESGRAGRP